MTPTEQKLRDAKAALTEFNRYFTSGGAPTSNDRVTVRASDWRDLQAALLSVFEALALPPTPDTQMPFGYFRALPFGWEQCAETDDGAIALYEHPTTPAATVTEDVKSGWVSINERIPRIDLDTSYLGINSNGYICTFNALTGAKCPNTGRITWYCEMETAEESTRQMSGITHWMPLPPPPAITAAQAREGGK